MDQSGKNSIWLPKTNSLDKLKSSPLYVYVTDYIKCPDITEFIERLFSVTPEYFWVLPSSTSKCHHGTDELLVAHVEACCWIMVNKVWPQMNAYWSDRTKALALAGMLIHDNWRCGYPGEEKRYSKEIIASRSYPSEILDTLMTDQAHAIKGGKIVDTMTDPDDPEDFSVISDCVRYHYGPWGEEKIRLDEMPYTSPVIQVHNIDFHQTNNSEFRTRQ